MLSITDDASLSKALKLLTCPALCDLINRRRAILGNEIPFTDMAHFVVVESGDTIDQIEGETGLAIRPEPPDRWPMWEWVMDHGFCFEAVFVLSDDGYAAVLFIEGGSGMNPELLGLIRAYVD